MTVSKAFLIFTLLFGILSAFFIGDPRAMHTVDQAAHAIVDLLVSAIIAGLVTSAVALFYEARAKRRTKGE